MPGRVLAAKVAGDLYQLADAGLVNGCERIFPSRFPAPDNAAERAESSRLMPSVIGVSSFVRS